MQLPPWLWTLLLSLLAYTTTSSLDRLPGGDSGELLAEACVGGVAHPPGYPLLLSLLRLVRWAINDRENVVHFVYWANAVNALMAASAAACVTHTVHLLTSKQSMEAVAAGLCFALSKLMWEYARGIEVFALNNLLVGILHVLMVKHFKQPSTKNACLGAFVCGLGLTNQHTIVLFEVPFIVAVLLTHRFRVVELLMVTMAFLMGLSFYLQTFWSALSPTPGSWGDTSTFEGLLAHVRRKEYGTFRLSPLQGTSEVLVRKIYSKRLVMLVQDLLSSACGFSLQKNSLAWYQKVGYVQISALVCYLLVFHSLANLPLDSPMPRAVSSRFNMQPNTILAIWLGLGFTVATRGIAPLVSTNLVKFARYSICLLLVAVQYQRNRDTGNDFAGDLIRRHGEAIFDVLPRNAVLLSYTDINWNSVRYLQVCEGTRPDVTHLSLQLLPFPWFPRQHELYPTIMFPPLRPDVSTIKSSSGYARFLHDFLAANIENHGGQLFLDLHAVVRPHKCSILKFLFYFSNVFTACCSE
ncbi:putative membrane protein [Phytophthora megakarya]|uniref:Putative membrane protein n=1 Tax=Phytophthora megakarya TaxID=4795 RepID=A0A225VWD0_9STRA|nr:putative membrane protein [Phytophthora megakarya]